MFASAAAYTGVMVAWGCAVWGTGYYYPPYVWYGGGYPIYRPFYPDLRLQRLVQPVDRHLRPRRRGLRSVRGRRRGARYNPSTGTYARGAAAWARTAARRSGRVQRTNGDVCPRRRRRRPMALAARRKPTTRAPGPPARPSGGRRLRQLGPDRRAARRRLGADLARHQSRDGNDDARDRGQRRRLEREPQHPGTGGSFAGKTGSGDVYAGRDGNVYRKEGDSWQKDDNGGWSNAQPPTQQQREAAQTARLRPGAGARSCRGSRFRFRHGRPAQSRLGGAQQRRREDARCRQRAQRRRRLTRGKLSAERRRHVARRRPAPLSSLVFEPKAFRGVQENMSSLGFPR